MNRKSFLRHLAAIPILTVLCRFLPRSMQAAMTSCTVRRVRPSDPGWPTAASWEKLKQQVGGQLIPVSSPLAPCRDEPNSAGCAARVEEMKNPYFIGEQAGGTQTSGWLDGWTSAPSAYAVAARRTEDFVAAVNFARDNNLRLVVKGGGHSYLRDARAQRRAKQPQSRRVPCGCTHTTQSLRKRAATSRAAGAQLLVSRD